MTEEKSGASERVMRSISEWRAEMKGYVSPPDLIEGLLPHSKGEYLVLAGRPGIGKTNLMINLAFSLATGTEWLGRKTRHSRVGYLALEGGKEKIFERFEKASANYHDPGDYLSWTISPPYQLRQSKEAIEHFRKTIKDLEVVIVDPLAIFASYSEPKLIQPFIQSFKSILLGEDVVGLITHHLRKRDPRYRVHPEDLLDEIKGAGDITALANSALILERGERERDEMGKYGPSDPNRRTLYFVKAKDAIEYLPPVDLLYHHDSLTFTKIK